MTGNIRGAGTNSKIHVVMHGSKGMKNSGKVMTTYRIQEQSRQLVLILKNNGCSNYSELVQVDKDLGLNLEKERLSVTIRNVCSGRFFCFQKMFSCCIN